MIKERKNIEWRPIEGFEEQYEVSNYGDFHILQYQFTDKAGRRLTRKERYIWSEDQSEYGGDSEEGCYLGIHLGGMAKSYSHRIAAKTFCPNPLNKPEVNHIDGNTTNNYCGCKELNYTDTNLEWVTRKENMEHASRTGLINHYSVLRKLTCKQNREHIDYNKMKRPVYQLTILGELVEEYESVSKASRDTGFSSSSIQSVASHDGYHKTAGGFNWVYKDEYDETKDYTVHIDLGSGNRKAIIQYDLQHNKIAEYKSIQEACRILHLTGGSYISGCCKGTRKFYKGFLWEYK